MAAKAPGAAVTRGLRMFTCGHSIHWWIPEILPALAHSAGIDGHCTVGVSKIGGSRADQHWDVPEDQNQAKRALIACEVDVLTLSCMTHADDGIRRFAQLAVKHNPGVRITLQELWLPEDRYPFDPHNRAFTTKDEFNRATLAELRRQHAGYFTEFDGYVRQLNTELGRPAVAVAPDGQATLLLRERMAAGRVPSLPRPASLFTDAWGHPEKPLMLLAAYVHFAVVYQRSPVGLPWPAVAAVDCAQKTDAGLNRDLQECAWAAVCAHPLSGVSHQS